MKGRGNFCWKEKMEEEWVEKLRRGLYICVCKREMEREKEKEIFIYQNRKNRQ